MLHALPTGGNATPLAAALQPHVRQAALHGLKAPVPSMRVSSHHISTHASHPCRAIGSGTRSRLLDASCVGRLFAASGGAALAVGLRRTSRPSRSHTAHQASRPRVLAARAPALPWGEQVVTCTAGLAARHLAPLLRGGGRRAGFLAVQGSWIACNTLANWFTFAAYAATKGEAGNADTHVCAHAARRLTRGSRRRPLPRPPSAPPRARGSIKAPRTAAPAPASRRRRPRQASPRRASRRRRPSRASAAAAADRASPRPPAPWAPPPPQRLHSNPTAGLCRCRAARR